MKMTRFVLSFLFILVYSLQIQAQEFTNHTVQPGETLYGIAKKYRVTPYNILKFNQEIRQEESLKPNTVLVIPLDPKANAMTLTPAVALQKLQDSVLPEPVKEPIDFKSHKVRRRETLYGISKRYQLEEEEIKRYNTELYATRLKKGMRLQIPIFPEADTTATTGVDPEDYEIYQVKPKETRWSIAHAYGITIDSLLVLNPNLPRTNNYLAEGQQLLLPKKAGSTVENQQIALFVSYTVPPKKTLYSLGKEFGVESSEIVRLNPEIMEQGGLKEGMVLRLPQKKLPEVEANTDEFVFYEVKPKQTEYSISRNLGITYQELKDLNPDLADGLKAGMVLKLPRDKSLDLEVKNSLVLDRFNLRDSINPANRPKLVFLLPFRLDKINLGDKESAKKAIQRSNAITYSLGLYSGALVALDSIAAMGISVDVRTYDTQLDLNRTRQILSRENLTEIDAIVGPLDPGSLKEVAVQASNYQIPVLAPVPFSSDLSLNNVFFSYTSDQLLRERMLEFIEAKAKDKNIVVIADSKNQEVEQMIQEKFPLAKSLKVDEDEENISINIEDFTLLLSEVNENWVFVETDNFKLISSVVSILNSTNTETTRVRMFTTNKNRAFDHQVISGSHLSNLNFTYPSVYREVGNDSFVRRYRAKFGNTPDRYAVRGFDLTFDLLLKLAYKPDLFEASRGIGTTEYAGNKFNYSKDLLSGYFNTASYIMMYDRMHIREVTQ